MGSRGAGRRPPACTPAHAGISLTLPYRRRSRICRNCFGGPIAWSIWRGRFNRYAIGTTGRRWGSTAATRCFDRCARRGCSPPGLCVICGRLRAGTGSTRRRILAHHRSSHLNVQPLEIGGRDATRRLMSGGRWHRDHAATARIHHPAPGSGKHRRHLLPGYLHPRWLRLLPVVPVPATGPLQESIVHADDFADACPQAIQRRAIGASNLSAEPPVQPHNVARALGPIPMPVPTWLTRSVIDATWRLRLQPIEPGWVDLIASAPLLKTERAQAILGWHPQHASLQALTELAEGLRRNEGTPCPSSGSTRTFTTAARSRLGFRGAHDG